MNSTSIINHYKSRVWEIGNPLKAELMITRVTNHLCRKLGKLLCGSNFQRPPVGAITVVCQVRSSASENTVP